MKRLTVGLGVVLVLLVGAASSHATVLLDEDFNSDPAARGWTTTAPDRVHWDSAGYYSANVTDQDYTPRWGKTPLFQQVTTESFTWQFDMRPVQASWGTYPLVALYQEGTGNPLLHASVSVEAHWSWYGDAYYKRFLLAGGGRADLLWSPRFDESKWYQQTVSYDATTQTLQWDIVEQASGAPFSSATVAGMSVNAFNRFAIGYEGEDGIYGHDAIIYVDNVKLDANVVPEPSTLVAWCLLGGFGGFALCRRNRRGAQPDDHRSPIPA